MHLPSIVIVTPALASANNGNWQTAQRWARMLRTAYKLRLCDRWDGGDASLMIALHARRSAEAVARWKASHPERPLVLVLTGTDLYRDIATDAAAQRSLALADRLVVLNALGASSLPPHLRGKCQVVLQSCSQRATLPKTGRHLRALMVGHLREEKDPGTYFAAARRLAAHPDILLDHIGAPLDPALGEAATALQAECPTYRWLGALPHAQTRQRIQAAHVLVHPSRMEGGAHVVIEALRSGTPVLASRIDGNLGLLGQDYPGCFEPGDEQALADQLLRLRTEPTLLADWTRAATERAGRFAPEHERATLLALAAGLLHGD